ncbi:alpha/beta hydrolase [Nocardia sp. NPDC050712]|uniref:alpha/beta fold hydrolase n=1 Tax=Nocardia sp. NPDC050712 TaxID=3155518 RepID=UPI003410424D
MTTLQDRQVGTAAGPLHLSTRPGHTDPVLALHGVSSTSRLWLWLHDADPELTLLAPDLAGRGHSPARPAGPSSVAAHAEHLIALLDALGLASVDVLGMSMGGFLATHLAAEYPGRVRSLTLVDGGLPVAPPMPRTELEAHLRTVYDTSAIWPDQHAYAAHYRRTAAPLVDPADTRLARMLDHELEPVPDGWRVRRDPDSVVEDALSVLACDTPAEVFARLRVPARLVYAQWSVGADSAPMYPVEHVESMRAGLLGAELVEGVDHAAIIMTDRGAHATAAALRAHLDRA